MEATNAYVALHQKDPSYGRTGRRLVPYVRLLVRDISACSLIDYGCGKSDLATRFRNDGVTRAARYDPYIESLSLRPEGSFDMAVNTDVLEHVPENELDRVIADMQSFTDKVVFVISTTFADKILDNGENAHCTIRDPAWWRSKLQKHFAVVEQIPTLRDTACSFLTWAPKPSTLLKLEKQKQSDKRKERLRRILALPKCVAYSLVTRHTTQSELNSALQGRSVALVGNSTRLQDYSFGSEIEEHDIIIRINRGPIIHALSHGARTDWIATSAPVSSGLAKGRKVSHVLWMTAKRRRMPAWMFKNRNVFINPAKNYRALQDRLGTRPSTGIMMIDLLARSACSKIDLYGFDFFAARSLSGARAATETPHDFDAEKRYFEELAASDGRLTLRDAPKSPPVPRP